MQGRYHDTRIAAASHNLTICVLAAAAIMEPVFETPLASAEQYRERIALRTTQAAASQRQHVLLGYARLALVIAGIALAWESFHQRAISRWWVLLPVVAFVAVARAHNAVLTKRAAAQRSIVYFEDGLARIENRFGELHHREPHVDASTSLFADDLDIFTRGGLFDLLCTARTSTGEEALAAALLHPAPATAIPTRQHAIAELATLFALREELASSDGPRVAKIHRKALVRWGHAADWGVPRWIPWLAPLLVAATLAAFLWYLLRDAGTLLATAVIVNASITFALLKRTQAQFHGAERASRSLQLASSLIACLEHQSFKSGLLIELQQRFATRGYVASNALARLALLTRLIEHRGNYIIRILDAPLMYSVQLAAAVQRWRRAHGPALGEWLDALAEFEALVSLATYSFEHPDDPFPEVVDGSPQFEAEQLGHPLIATDICVRNSVTLNDEARLLLISGSNMSGKSTLLRAVGINVVLAMAGAPVRAQRLRLTPMRIGASIRVHDSLQQGRSRFYAEVLRLRDILALSENSASVLFLLDELFGGTNSSDRLAGAEGVARALLANGAIGMISTHDLALTEIGVNDLALRNVHFEDRIEDGKMIFDFTLRGGVVSRRNGLELMRIVGLKV